MSLDWSQLCDALLGNDQVALPPNLKLPSLPAMVLDFGRRMNSPAATAADLGRLVESDPRLHAQLLLYANHCAGVMRGKTRTAGQAIETLGARAAQLVLLSQGVHQSLRCTRSKLMNLQSFGYTNLERALIARQVALLLRTDAEAAFAASLLHDCLLPSLTHELFNDYLKFSETPEEIRRPLVDFEKEAFGWDHGRMTAQVLRQWRFPDELVCAVLLHHGGLAILADPELGRTPAAAVAVAALLPDPLRQTRNGLEQLQHLSEVWPAFDLPEIANRAAAQLMTLSPTAGQHYTLQRRLEKLTTAVAINSETRFL